jgi:RNA polymerase sigma-70 factor (ECF subfamily)
MKNINLKDYYPFYESNHYVEVDDIIAATIKAFELLEKAYMKRTKRHKAFYSLDRNDGIERDIILIVLTPQEILERRLTNQELYTAMNSLSDKQTRRIYAHFFLGMSKYAIAKAEAVDESSIRKSIETGLKRMAVFLRNP